MSCGIFLPSTDCVIGLNLPFLPQKIWNVPWQSFQMRCCHDIVWPPAFSLSKFSLPPFHSSRFQNKIHVGRCWSCSRAVSISTLDFLETHLPCLHLLLWFFFLTDWDPPWDKNHHLSTSFGIYSMFGSLFPSAFSYQIPSISSTVAEIS